VAGDDEFGVDVLGELRRLVTGEVAGDTALGAVAVDGKEGEVDFERSQDVDDSVVEFFPVAANDELPVSLGIVRDKPSACPSVSRTSRDGS